jgi:ferric-dicitrate binding protein FerR (iron transport regulator)
MLTQHQHRLGQFDPGHCRACAHEAGLLDHYRRVQQEEDSLRATTRLARQARSYASWALWVSGVGIVVAAVALLRG